MPPRRLPLPWTIDERDECFIVVDAEGKHLAYVYFKPDDRLHNDRHAISRDEARRVETHVARLPELLKKDGA